MENSHGGYGSLFSNYDKGVSENYGYTFPTKTFPTKEEVKNEKERKYVGCDYCYDIQQKGLLTGLRFKGVCIYICACPKHFNELKELIKKNEK